MEAKTILRWLDYNRPVRFLPMRIPESLRAIGTEGFKISSLKKEKRSEREMKSASVWRNWSTKRSAEEQRLKSHQIWMMLSLLSLFRLIFACNVAAILTRRSRRFLLRFEERRKGIEVKRKRKFSPYLAERSFPCKKLMRVEHLLRWRGKRENRAEEKKKRAKKRRCWSRARRRQITENYSECCICNEEFVIDEMTSLPLSKKTGGRL